MQRDSFEQAEDYKQKIAIGHTQSPNQYFWMCRWHLWFYLCIVLPKPSISVLLLQFCTYVSATLKGKYRKFLLSHSICQVRFLKFCSD